MSSTNEPPYNHHHVAATIGRLLISLDICPAIRYIQDTLQGDITKEDDMLIFVDNVKVAIDKGDVIVLFSPANDDYRLVETTDPDGWKRYTFIVKKGAANDTR